MLHLLVNVQPSTNSSNQLCAKHIGWLAQPGCADHTQKRLLHLAWQHSVNNAMPFFAVSPHQSACNSSAAAGKRRRLPSW
jgi:hypothetical protein